MMKRRILTTAVALVCTLTLFVTGIAPAYACVMPFSNESDVVAHAEEFRWYYRNNNGVEEMRLWSITYQEWVTDWVPVPEGWHNPNT